MLTRHGWDEIDAMAKVHVERARRNLLDVVTDTEFSSSATSCSASRGHHRTRRGTGQPALLTR